jgi:hypothetical protein
MKGAVAYRDKGRDSNVVWNIVFFTAVLCRRMPVLFSTVRQIFEMFIFLSTSKTNPVGLQRNLNLDEYLFYFKRRNFYRLLQ